MRFLGWVALFVLISMPGAFAEDIDPDKLARSEREQLAGCMTDTMKMVENYHLGNKLFSLWHLFEATCGIEIERVTSAVENQLKEDVYKKVLPGQIILSMVQNAANVLEKRPASFCSGTGCGIEEYRTCLIRQMPAAIRLRKGPIDFEKQIQEKCEDSESAVRGALSNDFNNVVRRHLAGGLTHKMNEFIGNIIIGTRQAVVVLYGEDLVKVQPGRKSCKPEMCGASECISLDSNAPSEYECVINQK